MKAQKVIVRCLIRRKNKSLWVAQSVEFGLASQGASSEEAQEKLFAQVDDYIREAMREPEYCKQLLSRKAPLSFRIEFGAFKVVSKFRPIAQLWANMARQSEHCVDYPEVRCA